jgi:ankyrin repeat protein
MQNEAPSPALSSSFKSQELNLTQILYSYVYSMGLSDNAENVLGKLDFFISNASSQISQETISQSSKSKLLKDALEKIKANYSSWQEKENRANSTESDTIESNKQEIKETLKCYQEYFLIKFSSDGTIGKCDPDIKDIFLNFNDGSDLLNSIDASNNKTALKTLTKFLNNYLVELTITTESKINDRNSADNPDENQSKEDDINKIKTILLTFPGGTSLLQSRISFACIDGTSERVQEGTFALNDSSDEFKSARENIDTATVKFIPKIQDGNQIHTRSCLLASLMIDRRKIAEIDNYFTSPQQDIQLNEIIGFSHNFAKTVRQDLLLPRENLLEEYTELLQKKEDENKERTINFKALKTFIEKAKNLGFVIDFYGLIKDTDSKIEGDEIESDGIESDEITTAKLISSAKLKEKYLQLPSDKFKKELSKVIESIPSAPKAFDYLSHLPDSQELFKISQSESSDVSDVIVTNRLDSRKIKNLVALFLDKEDETRMSASSPSAGNIQNLISFFSTLTTLFSSKEDEDEKVKKSKMFAGLITLRSILDGHKTTDNSYLYFLKFDKEFEEKTGSSFKDFFYEERDGALTIKAEFIEAKPILETIESRRNFKEQSFYRNSDEILLKRLTTKLLSLENFEQAEFKELLAPDAPYIKIKSGLGENFLHILCQFDEEAFKKALEEKPELIAQITEKNNQNSSLIKTLIQEGDKELLFYALEKYKKANSNADDITGSKALIKMIHDQELFFDIVKANRADILKEVIKTVDDETAINFNQKDSSGSTILSLACSKGYTEIITILLKKNADPHIEDNQGCSPLFMACENGHIKAVEALIEGGVNLNQARTTDGTTPLFMACQKGHLKVVEALIAVKVNLDQTCNGVTPLFIACEGGRIKVVEALIEGGANLNKAQTNGETPLYVACQNGNIEIVKALIAGGANLDQARTIDGATPLYVACKNGHIEVVKALIAKGANLDQRTTSGTTPLFTACKSSRIEVVKALFDAGANIDF